MRFDVLTRQYSSCHIVDSNIRLAIFYNCEADVGVLAKRNYKKQLSNC
jgi:hypothetical protein